MDGPPSYTFSIDWLSTVLGKSVSSVQHKALVGEGGMMCSLQRITVHYEDKSTQSFIFKQIAKEHTDKCKTSKTLGLTREACFYNWEGLKEGGFSFVAKPYYAYKDDETGEKYLLLEDLSPAVQAGLLFGPGNPNNWAKSVEELDAITKTCFASGGNLQTVCEMSFRAMAKLHARFWKKEELKSLNWLRACDWFTSETVPETWKTSQHEVKERFETLQKSLSPTLLQENGVQWDPEFFKILEASVKKISWDSYKEWTKNLNWTFVVGDCHPANTMWISGGNSLEHVKIVDFEMVGVGSGPQDLAQFLISHMEPQTRKECEIPLLKSYYEQLQKEGVPSSFTWEMCLDEYVRGGAERWIWMCVWMGVFLPKKMTEFFNTQTYAFIKDHGITAETIGQPRP